jgi:hypothetical protein
VSAGVRVVCTVADKKGRKPVWTERPGISPCDGFKINNLVKGLGVGGRYRHISLFESDKICVELSFNSHRYYIVSVLGEVRRVNAYRGAFNGYKDHIKGR